MRRTLTLGLLTALAFSPIGSAGWGVSGAYEPDTTHDVDDGWMFTDPDVVPTDDANSERRVYLNGWHGVYPLQPTSPNSAALRSQFSFPAVRYYAFMGVWKDCNGDGYVGFADNGLFEYRTELLLGDNSVCKPGPIPDPIPFGWVPPHNDGQWVHEMIPIAWNRANAEVDGDLDQFNINDNSSRIWIDFGLPVPGVGGQGCWINPQPRGTYHSVGGVIEYADCHTAWKITDGTTAVIASVNGDNLGLGQLSFDDSPRDQSESDSLLNVRNPWGDEHEGSFVELWNCGAAPLYRARDPTAPADGPGELYEIPSPTGGTVNVTGEDGYLAYVNVSAPRSTPGTSTTGTPAGTVNSTVSGTDRCERRDDAPGTRASGAATLPYTQEADLLNDAAKQQTDPFTPTIFGFEGARPASPVKNAWRDLCGDGCDFTDLGLEDYREPPADIPWGEVVGRGAPPNLGSNHADALFSGSFRPGGMWSNTLANYVDDYTTREFAPRPVAHTTIYGYVSPAAISAYSLVLPKGTLTGTYGEHACGTNIGVGAPAINGWDCDPSKWYFDAAGTDIEARDTFLGDGDDGNGVPIGIRPGQAYNLRDIDCYDESTLGARELGAHWGVLTGSACSNAPGDLLPVV